MSIVLPSSKLEWYQTDDTVTITIKLKGINKDNGLKNIQFKEGSVKGIINHINKGKVDTYNIDIKLWGEIEYDKAKYDITPYKIELHLPKKDKLIKWPSLEKDDTLINNTKEIASSNYPSSSKVHRDWSQIDKICDNELKGEKENGDAALNELFRKIYKDADDDTRRAMIKSFQTSGGTVLSTNWDEVGKADYEGKDRPDAPDGQEWKKCFIVHVIIIIKYYYYLLMYTPSYYRWLSYKIIFLLISCIILGVKGGYLNDDIIHTDTLLNNRELDDEAAASTVIIATPTSPKRHDYHRSELIGAWLMITIVPIAWIIFFCITAPRVRQREILFKLFHRDAVFNRGNGGVGNMQEMEDLEIGKVNNNNGVNNKLWDKIRGKSKAAAKVGSNMAANVIGKAKPVIKSATNKIDRTKRHYKRQQRKGGFTQLDNDKRGGDGGYVKYNIYDDEEEEEETNFGIGLDDEYSSSSPSSSSWSSSLVSSSRDGSPVSLIIPQQEDDGIATTTFNDDDLIGYYEYYEKEGEIEQQHQQLRQEKTILTAAAAAAAVTCSRKSINTSHEQEEEELQVRRVSFDTKPPQEIDERYGPEITEITYDNNNDTKCNITDNNIKPITDNNIKPIKDDNIKPIKDDNIKPIRDDNDKAPSSSSYPPPIAASHEDGLRIRLSSASSSSRFSYNSRRLSGIISSSDDEERYMSANESNCYQSCYSSGGSTSDDEADEVGGGGGGGDDTHEEEGIEESSSSSSSFTSNESISDIITGGASSDNSDKDDEHHRHKGGDIKSCKAITNNS